MVLEEGFKNIMDQESHEIWREWMKEERSLEPFGKEGEVCLVTWYAIRTGLPPQLRGVVGGEGADRNE